MKGAKKNNGKNNESYRECGCIICDNGANIPTCDINFLQVGLVSYNDIGSN